MFLVQDMEQWRELPEILWTEKLIMYWKTYLLNMHY